MARYRMKDQGSLGKPFEVKGTGHVLAAGGQSYTCVLIEPYTRKDGAPSAIAHWEAHCAECGAPFIHKTSLAGGKFQPNRRCPEHHKPTKRVPRRIAKPKIAQDVFG